MDELREYDVSVNGRVLKLSPEYHENASAVQYCAPRSAGQIRVNHTPALFSADAVCAAALVFATQKKESGHTVVMVEVSDTRPPVPAVVDMRNGHVTVCPPVPVVHETVNGVRRLDFPGIRCYVGLEMPALPEEDLPVLLVSRNGDCSDVKASFCSGSPESIVLLPGSGLAAAAAVIDYAATFPDGVSECGVGMPGGDLEVGVSVRDGAVTGLSVCSIVRMLSTGGAAT